MHGNGVWHRLPVQATPVLQAAALHQPVTLAIANCSTGPPPPGKLGPQAATDPGQNALTGGQKAPPETGQQNDWCELQMRAHDAPTMAVCIGQHGVWCDPHWITTCVGHSNEQGGVCMGATLPPGHHGAIAAAC